MLSRFFSGQAGEFHVALYLPESDSTPRHWILHLPAFAEEMNKCRPMVSRQARALAASGFAVMVPDLFGTGDSDGEFGEADWHIWIADMVGLLAWAEAQGARSLTFWGSRTGCLMALDLLAARPDNVVRLLFWQPVIDGGQFITQFLRLRLVAAMMTGERIGTDDLRNRLEAGESLEIAGYDLSPGLYTQLGNRRLGSASLSQDVVIDWLEVVPVPARPLTPVAAKAVAALEAKGARITVTSVQGEAFWATQEIAFAPALIESTTGILVDALQGQLLAVVEQTDDAETGAVEQSIGRRKAAGWLKQVAGEDIGPVPPCVRPVTFACEGSQLLGMFHRSQSPDQANPARTGVLVVVGGPQYRVGSHRQFVYLARHLAAAGVPVLRFDYRGMGDSEGDYVGFDGIAADIRAAVDELFRLAPELQSVVIWGLCDAATAASCYWPADQRISGLVLLNPWVRSEAGAAKAYLKHYYLQRLFSRDLWRKIASGSFRPGEALASLLAQLASAGGRARPAPAAVGSSGDGGIGIGYRASAGGDLVERMRSGLAAGSGKALFILSGRDLTCAEFRDAARESRKFSRLLRSARFQQRFLDEADHTFSTRAWRDRVSTLTLDWLRSDQDL